MAANPAHLITVDEFRRLPEPPDGCVYELHHGKLVPVTRPKLKHHLLQARLRDLLRAQAPQGSFVEYETAFRAFPEYDLRIADVAYVSPARWATADHDDNLFGAPDLVVEVLSPSNTVREMYEKERLCLEHGSQEFWGVDLDARTVRVASVRVPTVMYRSGQSIPLGMLGTGCFLLVSDLFN